MSLSFPASPTTGQIYQNWVWNGSAWQALTPGGGVPINVQVFTASGTYVPSPGMTSCMVECVGAGGGGGSSGNGATYNYAGGGGASGGYSRKLLTAAQVGGSQTVTIGAGGAGAPTNTTVNGGSGTATSLGTLCVANGGGGGQSAANSVTAYGGIPGSVASAVGDVRAAGNSGGPGYSVLASSAFGSSGGIGGASFFGGAAISGWGTGFSGVGQPGGNYGGGGSGGVQAGTAAFIAGGNGAPGVCIITEYGVGLATAYSGPFVSSVNGMTGAVTLPPNPGSKVRLQRLDITSPVANIQWISQLNPAAYDEYELEYYSLIPATEAAILIRCSTDGVTFDSGSNYTFSIVYGASSGAAGTAGSASGLQIGNAIGLGSNVNNMGTIRLLIPASVSGASTPGYRTGCTYNYNHQPASGQYGGSGGSWYNQTTLPVIGLQMMLAGSYNFNRGTVILSGIAR